MGVVRKRSAEEDSIIDGDGLQRLVCAGEIKNTRGMAKRGYSREFTPAPQGHRRYLLDKIPAPLWRDVRAKAKQEGISVRALILKLLTDWTQQK